MNTSPEDLPRPAPVTLRQAWRFWLKLGCIGFGGPAGQIAIMPLDSGLEEPIEHLSFMQLPDASVLAPLGLVMRKTEPRSAIAEKCFAEARKLFGVEVSAQ